MMYPTAPARPVRVPRIRTLRLAVVRAALGLTPPFTMGELEAATPALRAMEAIWDLRRAGVLVYVGGSGRRGSPQRYRLHLIHGQLERLEREAMPETTSASWRTR